MCSQHLEAAITKQCRSGCEQLLLVIVKSQIQTIPITSVKTA